MVLGAFFNPTGHHVASWRHPDADADAGINFRHYMRIAQTAERGKFQLMFLADQLSVRSAHMDALSRSAQYIAQFEPLTLLSALSAVTSRIGLVATATTSYNEPYHVARAFASLDHLSGGRAGWNIVTSGQENEAGNFGQESHLEHSFRYERAREFVQLVEKLWDSWDDDAFTRDRESGLFFVPERLHTANHHEKFFNVRGPLNIPRPPQGHPVLVQAGQSPTGRAFAADYAEVIFTSQPSLPAALRYTTEVKQLAAAHGRDPSQIKVLPGLSAIIGDTQAEADAKAEQLHALTDPVVAREIMSTQVGGFDFSVYPLDGPMPEIPETNANKGAGEQLMEEARRENLTIRQMAYRVAAARGKRVVRGTASTIADMLEEWFSAGACDGFNVMPSYLPGGLDDFVDQVVPELQRRGLFHTEYEGATLRENLGLMRPASVYAAPQAA